MVKQSALPNRSLLSTQQFQDFGCSLHRLQQPHIVYWQNFVTANKIRDQ